MLLYAHGTATNRATNLANVLDPNNQEGVLIAAMFAAHGFIVVAPNYAGYDSSPLPYHPFLNGTQQSSEMIDALKAARAALPNIPASATTDAHLLFVTGYSQGGYVAMATAKALQAAADPTFVASAPMSGPYALAAFGDQIFFGGVNLGSTVFAPMIATSYQRQFGNIYNSPTDPSNIFELQFSATIDALLPSNTPLSVLQAPGPGQKLPQTTLFSGTLITGTPIDAFFAGATPPAGNPLFALGFTAAGVPGNLITNPARRDYVLDAFTSAATADGAIPPPPPFTPISGVPLAASPANNLRKALKANDMRTWAPTHPMFLCGGRNDPTVFFAINTGTMAGSGPSGATQPQHAGAFWDAQVTGGLVRVFDVDTAPLTAPNPADPAGDQLRGAFALAMSAFGAPGSAAYVQAYHQEVAPFCSKGTQGFFAAVLGGTPIPFP
jgi:acetyl esterase/lipase